MPYMQKATHEQLVELLPHKWKLLKEDPYPKDWSTISTTDNTQQ